VGRFEWDYNHRLTMLASEFQRLFPLSLTPVGRLAVRICERTAGESNGVELPPPQEVFTLLLQSLQMLMGCCSTPEKATRYVNSQRSWRVSRISRELQRNFQATYPIYPPVVAESIVRSILYECKTCNLYQMQGYLDTTRGFAGL